MAHDDLSEWMASNDRIVPTILFLILLIAVTTSFLRCVLVDPDPARVEDKIRPEITGHMHRIHAFDLDTEERLNEFVEVRCRCPSRHLGRAIRVRQTSRVSFPQGFPSGTGPSEGRVDQPQGRLDAVVRPDGPYLARARQKVDPKGVLRLNVGGRSLQVLRSTLTSVDNSLLAALFSGRYDRSLRKDASGCIFVDDNFECFYAMVTILQARKGGKANINLADYVDDDQVSSKVQTWAWLSGDG